MALARERDLEAGRLSIAVARRGSVAKDIILEDAAETESMDSSASVNVRVKVNEVHPPAPAAAPHHLDGQGVEETDYGTMATTMGEGKRAASIKRPGFVRQVTSESLFKDPVWGRKGGDE